MTRLAARTRTLPLLFAVAAILGLVLLTASPGVSSAAQSVRPAAAGGAPQLLKPKVTHEPYAYELLGVGCYSAKYCVAVGGGGGKSYTGGVAIPIKNGVPGKPILSANSTSVYYGVACVSTSECIIAGAEAPQGQTSLQAVVWLLRGTKLTLVSQSDSTDNSSAEFRGAACWSATRCVVDGDATYLTSGGVASIGVFGEVYLRGTPSVDVVDNDALGYANSAACPSAKICYLGGSSEAVVGAEAFLYTSDGKISGPFDQPTVAGIDHLACESTTACGAAEAQDLESFGQFAGWVERLNGDAKGTPAAVPGAQVMFGIATVNQSYYLAVGYSNADVWLADLVTAAGKPLTPVEEADAAYLQAVTCPVQTECIAVGFTSDPNPVQPGGVDGVDGAIAVFRLRTAPSAPSLKVTHTTDTSVTLKITPPASDGNAAIRSYRLVVTRCRPHRSSCRQEQVKSVTIPGSKRSVTITGLAGKTTYYFEAAAANAIGTGPYSARVHART